ncbi:MAG: hypothetical protein R2867_38945 [Caldilineaceae bacterium]
MRSNRHYNATGAISTQTDATVGTGTEVEYFTFGRDVARLDFTSHQGNDFQMTDEDWQRLNNVVHDFPRTVALSSSPATSGPPTPPPAATTSDLPRGRPAKSCAPAIGRSPTPLKLT